jgi:oxalate decarboxylase/phosphoglucose isomerase-like protein (cupin superfamily)
VKLHHVRAGVRGFADRQPLKHGVWASSHLQVAVWRLNPGQRIVAHCHPNADDVMVILRGSGEYLGYDVQPPPHEVQYVPRAQAVVVPPPVAGTDEGCRRIAVGPGSVVVAANGVFHGLVNVGDDQLVVAVVTGPDARDSVYTVR